MKRDKPPAEWPLVFKVLGVPEGVMEHRFYPSRRWRFDYAWPAERVALEVEGGVWTGGRHTRGAGFMGDLDKYNRAVLLGWAVLRCTPQQMASGEAAVLILEALANAHHKDG